MWTRKKSIRSRTKRTRRKQSKFITPDLALVHGQMLRFVAGPDDPLRAAERVRGEFAQLMAAHHVKVGQFLQQAYSVAAQFRRRPRDFERFQVHEFWKQTGTKPKDRWTSKWVLLFLMQATTTKLHTLAGKFALILDGLLQDQVEISAVAARINELGGIRAAYEAMQARKRTAAPVSGTVAVAKTAAAGPRTRRDDQTSPPKIGKPLMLKPTQRPRRRRPEPTRPKYPLVTSLFSGKKIEPYNPSAGTELLAVEEIEEGCALEIVPVGDAFDFVQRLAGEYAKIKDGDHQSVRRVLQRAYLAAQKMQREPGEFKRLQADPFWKASFHKPQDASTAKWVVYFIMQARTPSVRLLAAEYTAILDRLLRDRLRPTSARIARMEGVEAAYAAVQARPRLRGLKSWSRRQGGNG
jgi:hypothetical protein